MKWESFVDILLDKELDGGRERISDDDEEISRRMMCEELQQWKLAAIKSNKLNFPLEASDRTKLKETQKTSLAGGKTKKLIRRVRHAWN
jgi:hypothetical protein